jgi:uridine phosphorylase
VRLDDLPLALLEFDDDRTALIEPAEVFAGRRGEIPPVAVLCFFSEVIDVAVEPGAAPITKLYAAHGSHPVHAFRLAPDSPPVAVVHPGVGAPLAAGFLEELIALGATTVVACGGAGAVIPGLALGHVVVPDRAVRDEGTSFHYAPPSREIDADPLGVSVAERVLAARGIPYSTGKTWTTDGLYRETRGRIARRRDEGCLTVEMEAAAFFAVARFRGIRFAQLLYAGDDVSGAAWDSRHWSRSTRRRALFDLAVEVALALAAAPAP